MRSYNGERRIPLGDDELEADVADSLPRPPVRHTPDDELPVQPLLLSVGSGRDDGLKSELPGEQRDADLNRHQTDGTGAGLLYSARYVTEAAEAGIYHMYLVYDIHISYILL